MKKLITIYLITTTVFAVNAQDGKPTKEETVEYLQSVILGVNGGRIHIESGKAKMYGLYEMELDDCTLKMKMEEGSERVSLMVKSDQIQEINFSEVVSFRFISQKPNEQVKDLNDNLLLYFATKKSKDNHIDGFFCNPEDSEKVLKALNHLRKLCGAPDPISFD